MESVRGAGGMAGIDLRVASTAQGGWAILSVEGEIDMLTAPKLREALIETIERGQNRIVVDLLGVTFMDSTGLGTLVGALKRVKERDGILALASGNRAVLRVLTITGLNNVFPIYATVDDALSAG